MKRKGGRLRIMWLEMPLCGEDIGAENLKEEKLELGMWGKSPGGRTANAKALRSEGPSLHAPNN